VRRHRQHPEPEAAASKSAILRRIAPLCIAVSLAAAAPALAGLTPQSADNLPPGTLRGPANRLDQYPTVSLASPAKRAAAQRLLREMRTAAGAWKDPRAAAAAGFGTGRVSRRAGDRSIAYVHAEHRGYRSDSEYLRPARPETLVYASVPGRPLVLIGVMFSMPRGKHGPTPGGAITRWHTHRVCVRGEPRGLAPRPDGSCPPGARSRQGSEMMHVWFTRDLRSAYAIHAPVPELCVARLLPVGHCRHGEHGHG
jgi:hypothetical protein